jgi:hypothetical protein
VGPRKCRGEHLRWEVRYLAGANVQSGAGVWARRAGGLSPCPANCRQKGLAAAAAVAAGGGGHAGHAGDLGVVCGQARRQQKGGW